MSTAVIAPTIPSVSSSSAAYGEFCAAAPVDPEAPIVITPGIALDAWGAADLAGETDTAAGVYITVVSFAVVRGAGDDLISTPVVRLAIGYWL